MTFAISAKKSVLKFLRQLDKSQKLEIYEFLQVLKKMPVPSKLFDIAKLKGYKSTYRVRFGKVRVVYEVFWKEKKIVIHFIGLRKKAYK